MFPKWLRGGRDAEPAADETAAVQRDGIDAKFSFERDELQLDEENGFCPLKDAAFRWCIEPKRIFASVGSEAEILYELRDGAFVLVRAKGLRPSQRDNDPVWTAVLEPRACVVAATWALGFVRKHRLKPTSPQMRELYDARKSRSLRFLLATTSVSYRPPRPVTLWADKGYAWRPAGVHAQEIDARGTVEFILWSLREAIEQLRRPMGSDSSRNLCLPFVPLFTRYNFDPLSALPEGVSATGADVPLEEACPEIRSSPAAGLLRELRELVIAPLNLLIEDSRTVPGRRDGPTAIEVEMAERAMRESVGELIRLTVALNAETQHLQAAEEVSSRGSALKNEADLSSSASIVADLASAMDNDEVPVLLTLLAFPAIDEKKKALAKEIAGRDSLRLLDRQASTGFSKAEEAEDGAFSKGHSWRVLADRAGRRRS